MPRVNLGKPPMLLQYEQQLREDYGKSLTVGNLCDLLNTGDRRTAIAFVSDLPYIMVGTRKRWMAADVARRMYERTVTP